jgi:hypothetical protein
MNQFRLNLSRNSLHVGVRVKVGRGAEWVRLTDDRISGQIAQKMGKGRPGDGARLLVIAKSLC